MPYPLLSRRPPSWVSSQYLLTHFQSNEYENLELPLNIVLDGGRLHEVSVHPVLLLDPLQPLPVALGVDARLG